MSETEILNQIAQKSGSDLILFFIIMAVVLVVFMLPLYSLLIKDKNEKN